jgi:regulator of CtrA degradation
MGWGLDNLNEDAPWRAAVIRDFAASELFARTFDEGMTLVEETAAYLDGGGRQDAKLLSRATALAYAGESMRLTTRLMQIASWLLVQRAVREGDMAAEGACEERYRLGAQAVCLAEPSDEAEGLPPPLTQLLDRSARLYERVRHLDRRMYLDTAGETQAPSPVLAQFDRLKAAFG